MTKAEEYFNALAREIPDVKPGKMFCAPCMKTPNGKSAAMLYKDDIVVKLQGDSFSEAMALDGAKLFEPMQGRPMKNRVQVPFIYKSQWKKFALSSAQLVKKIKKKS